MAINNRVFKWLLIICGIILTDFYFFPLTLVVFPYGNTKMVMAAVSVCLILVGRHYSTNTESITRPFIALCMGALLVSLCAFITVVINNTHDYTYCSYIVSMLVWLGGAYTLNRYLIMVHGDLNLRTIVFYLIVVCALQCISAMLLSRYPVFDSWINRIVVGQKDLKEFGGDRLVGIACAFDVAGIRFSGVLIMGFFFLKSTITDKNISFKAKVIYFLSLMIIAVIGNIISRTTTIGLAIGLGYVVLQLCVSCDADERREVAKWFFSTTIISVLVCVLFYNIDSQFRSNIRFGFEGFFGLVETGEWNVHSNDQLKGMMNVLPDNLGTWVFGDGLFVDTTKEPWYVGQTYQGYYMGVDIGYLRFIFYFGIIGLVSFIVFLLYSAKVCIEQFPNYRVLFYMLMLIQFVVFVKVSTDMFLIFALCMACGFVREQFDIEKENINMVKHC